MRRKKMNNGRMTVRFLAAIVAVLCTLWAGAVAHAALKAAGPVNAVGFPAYYTDTTGFALAPCLDQNGFCILPPPLDTPAAPITPGLPINATNFPLELFYWFAESTIPIVGPAGADQAILRLVLEGSFANGTVTNGQQMAFLRVNLKAMRGLTPGTYTVTHPFGTFTFTADAAGDAKGGVGNQAFRAQDGGLAAGDFTSLLPAATTGIGPFLRCASGPVTAPDGNVYIGNPAIPCAATGAANNFFRITGPNIGGQGINTTQTNLFALSGKMDGITVAPTTFAYAPQNAPGVPRTTTFTVTNLRPTPLTPGAVTFTGPQALQFAVGATTCNIPVAAKGTCTIDVIFIGQTPDGTKTATMNIAVADPAFMPPAEAAVSGVIDGTPPTVLSTTPVDATTAPANTTITAVFSEPMLASSITVTSFTVTANAAPVSGAISYDAVNNAATFRPAADFAVGVTVAATLAGTNGARDIAGNALAAAKIFSFVTTPPDRTPPTVSSTESANGSTGAPVNSAIKVIFSEKMNAASIKAATFTLSTLSGDVTGVISYDAATNTAILTPSTPLEPGTPYTATVTTGVEDLAQNSIGSNFVWQFLTNNPPSAPGLLTPADGATGLPTTVALTWTKATDDDGDTLTYNVYVCNNQFFLGCSANTVTASAPRLNGAYFAGVGGLGMAVIGLVSFGGIKGRKRFLALMIVVLLMSGVIVASCGGGGGGGDGTPAPSNEVSFSPPGLTPGTPYYWKVEANDGKAGLVSSETRSFRTQ
jgi:hypothetical protein